MFSLKVFSAFLYAASGNVAVVATALCLCIALYAFVLSGSGIRRPPGPRHAGPLGNWAKLPPTMSHDNEARTLIALARRYGALVGLRALHRWVYVVNDAATSRALAPRDPTPSASTWSQSVVGVRYVPRPTAAFHSLFASVFAQIEFRHIARDIVRVCQEITSYWNVNHDVKVAAFARDAVIRSIEAAALGSASTSRRGSASDLKKAWQLDKSLTQSFSGLFKNDVGSKEVLSSYSTAIAERFDYERTRGTTTRSVLGSLYEHHPDLTPNTVAQQLLDYVLASNEGIGMTLEAALRCVAAHPTVQDTMRAELDDVMCGRRTVEPYMIENLPWTWCVLREVQRLNPITTMSVIRAQRGTIAHGFIVPRGSDVIVNHAAIAQCPKTFTAPAEFLPERWLPEGCTQKQLPSCVPETLYDFDYDRVFGIGFRKCAGQRFAEHHIVLMIAQLVRTFNIAPSTTGNDAELLFTRLEVV